MRKKNLEMWIYIFLLTKIKAIFAVRVDKFGLSDGVVPEKGSDITMTCDVTISESDGLKALILLKEDKQLATCYLPGDYCSVQANIPASYTVTHTQPSMIIKITNLQISDGGKWYCGFKETVHTQYTLPVYVKVTSVTLLDGNISPQDGDFIELTENQEKTLTCRTGDSNPPSIIMWYINDQMKQNGTNVNFKFTPTSNDHDKRIQCKGYNIQPADDAVVSAKPKLFVKVRVTSVTLKDGTKTPSNSDTIEVITGETKRLTCVTSTSRPVATIVWYIGSNVKQRGTSTEYIYSPQYEDNNDRIYCKAYNIQTEGNAVLSNTPKLNVRVKVTTVTLFDGNMTPQDDDTIEVTENQEKTLTCRTGFGNPPSIIMWFINGQLKQNGTNVNFTFTPNNNDHDNGIQCKAYNIQPPNEAVASASLKVFVKVPVLSVILTDGNVSLSDRLEVTKGVSKTLTCSTGVSRPTSTIIWYIDKKEIKRSTNNTSSLPIIPENDLNGTQVFCKAFNIQPENQAVSSLNITLYVKDTIFFVNGKEGSQDVFVDEYEADITFVCQVYSFMEYHVRIMFQDKILKEKTQTRFLSYTHNSVTCFDAGVYSCKGNNQHGQAPNASINLFVRCSPRPLEQLKHNFTSKLHTPATLSLTAIAYPEPGPAGFVWHKEMGIRWTALRSNTDLQISSTGLQSNLTILNVSGVDYGQYRLTVTNIIGSYEQYLFLVQEDKESKTCTENVTPETCQAELIIGISFGILVIALVFYGTVVTILLKRGRSKKGTQLFDELNKKTNYVNLAEDESTGRQNDPTRRNDISGRNEEDSVKVYTDLARYSKGEGSTYDIIQKS